MTEALSTVARAALLAIAIAMTGTALAAEFSVSPIRADLKPGALTETITVANQSPSRLRVTVKLLQWTQDEQGKDIYTDSGDIVYFPRQMDVDPSAKRIVRVGAKAPGAGVEKTYRLFIEEVPEAKSSEGRAQVAFYFRFGVPIFVPPAGAKPQPVVGDAVLRQGKVSALVSNNGNEHFRLTKVTVSDNAGFSQEIAGWYSLAGTQRTYSVDVPADVCRKSRTLTMVLEGEGIRFERTLNVDPASCL